MSDVARKCKKCGFKWWAAKADKPRKIRGDNGDLHTGMFTLSRSAKFVKKSHNENLKTASWEHFSRCSRCGSSAIATVSRYGFTPTVVEQAAQDARATAAETARDGAAALAIRIIERSTARTANSSGAVRDAQAPRLDPAKFLPGEHVTIHQLGWRGKRGTVVKKGLLGIQVAVEDGRNVTIDPAKLSHDY